MGLQRLSFKNVYRTQRVFIFNTRPIYPYGEYWFTVLKPISIPYITYFNLFQRFQQLKVQYLQALNLRIGMSTSFSTSYLLPM